MRFITILSCIFVWALPLTANFAADPIPLRVNFMAWGLDYTHPNGAKVSFSAAHTPILPIEPVKKAATKVKKGLKKSYKCKQNRPNWDIYWLTTAIIGLGLYPISLSLYLCGLGFGLAGLTWAGVLGLFILFLGLFLLFLTLKRNKSSADRFFERYSLLLLWAGIFLAGLGTFIIGLLLAALWVWIIASLVFLGAGVLLFFAWKDRKG